MRGTGSRVSRPIPSGDCVAAPAQLYERLRYARDRQRLTLEQLEEAIGLEEQTLRRLESGSHRPSLRSLRRLSERLRVTSDWLLAGLAREPVATRPQPVGDRCIVFVDEEELPSLVGSRIITARVARSWRQRDLAAACRFSPSQVSRYECGRCLPSALALRRLSQVCGVTSDGLLGLDALEVTPDCHHEP